MAEHCEALNRDGWAAFCGNREPICPHCGTEVDAGKHDLWRIYEEGEHEIDCPCCDRPFTVSARVKYTFSTDQQESSND